MIFLCIGNALKWAETNASTVRHGELFLLLTVARSGGQVDGFGTFDQVILLGHLLSEEDGIEGFSPALFLDGVLTEDTVRFPAPAGATKEDLGIRTIDEGFLRASLGGPRIRAFQRRGRAHWTAGFSP